MLNRRLRRYVRSGMLTQLAAFEAVVRLGSFTRAAEALHMAQPTVSILVKKLSEALDVPLFESTTREMRLTPAGEETYKFCQDFFQDFAGLDERLTALRAGPSAEPLHIAVCTAAESVVSSLLGPFCKRYPQGKLKLTVANRKQLLERLRAGTDHLYILGSPPSDIDVCVQDLQEEELHIYASVAHPFARRRRVSIEELAREPLLMREAGSGTREALEALFAQHDCKPNIRMEMDNNDAIKKAVAAGFGVAFLSQYAVKPTPRHEAITPVRVDGLPLRRRWQLAYRPDCKLTAIEEELIGELIRQSATLGESYRAPSQKQRKSKVLRHVTGAGPILKGT